MSTLRRIYVSAPVVSFDPEAYYKVLAAFRARGAELVDSRALFPDMEAWRRGYPQAIEQADAVLILLGPRRVIGVGVMQEVCAARLLRRDIYFAQTNGAVRPAHGVWLRILPGASRKRFILVNFEPRQKTKPGAPGS